MELKQFINKNSYIDLERFGAFQKGYKLVYIGALLWAFKVAFLARSFHQQVQIYMEIMIIQ